MNNQERISRNDFLKSLGLKGAALLAVYCSGATLTSCQNEAAGITPDAAVGTALLTLDLTTTTALKTIGGYVQSNNVVVAQVSAGKYIAVTQICSHEGQKQVVFKSGEFYCTAHGARFDTAGKGLNGNGSGGLKVYTVTVTGTTLKVTA
ncbi:MAG: Rieske 2Fe-2S domain-containing protein [Bacteroidota bacterium]